MGRARWTSRKTVEDCPIHLSTESLGAAGVFQLPAGTRAVTSWPMSDGSSLGSLRFEIRVNRNGRRFLYIFPQPLAFGGRNLIGEGQPIPLITTRPHFGGQRYWFSCECGRRAARLYLPTGAAVFRCRICCDLTYQSSQEHNTQWGKMRSLIECFQ